MYIGELWVFIRYGECTVIRNRHVIGITRETFFESAGIEANGVAASIVAVSTPLAEIVTVRTERAYEIVRGGLNSSLCAKASNCWANSLLSGGPPAAMPLRMVTAWEKPWLSSDGSLRSKISVNQSLPVSRIPLRPTSLV